MQALSQLLSPGRTLCRAPGTSKKRVLEAIANLIGDDQSCMNSAEIFSQLIAREKLGSTGLGNGIAIPHCRAENCGDTLGALLTLDEAVDFDAPDNKPVDLLFVLLVPAEAHQAHLDALAAVAGLFSQDEFCRQLRDCRDSETLYTLATTWQA